MDTQDTPCGECTDVGKVYNREPKAKFCQCGAELLPPEEKKDGHCVYCGTPRMFAVRRCPEFTGSTYAHDEALVSFNMPI